MFKNTLLVCLSIFLFSCGEGDDTIDTESDAKYSLIMLASGDRLESDKLDYMGSGNTMTFGIGEKGELKIFDMYKELNNEELVSFEGKSYPGSVVFNDNEFEGEVTIEKVKLEEDVAEINSNKSFKISGTFTAEAGDKIKFGVSLFRMK